MLSAKSGGLALKTRKTHVEVQRFMGNLNLHKLAFIRGSKHDEENHRSADEG